MHNFFTPSCKPLQERLVELLAEDGVHSVLPLLGVNRLLRGCAIGRMLSEYEKTKIVRWEEEEEDEFGMGGSSWPILGEGEYILCVLSGCSPYDGPFASDDPRAVLAEANSLDMKKRSTALRLSSYDAATGLCTFTSKKGPSAGYHIICNSNHDEWKDLPQSFDFIPTAWFRPATSSSTAAHSGLELAARPDRHPPVLSQVLSPKTPPKPAATVSAFDPFANMLADPLDSFSTVEEKNVALRSEWTVSYRTSRIDSLAQRLLPEDPDMVYVPAHLDIDELKVPLIDLFAPRTSLEEPGFYEM
ncbi:hypothetical protein JCM10213_002465 [Rhodosporidiobolus nylandii]